MKISKNCKFNRHESVFNFVFSKISRYIKVRDFFYLKLSNLVHSNFKTPKSGNLVHTIQCLKIPHEKGLFEKTTKFHTPQNTL